MPSEITYLSELSQGPDTLSSKLSNIQNNAS